jgi:hypothetical protein
LFLARSRGCGGDPANAPHVRDTPYMRTAPALMAGRASEP